MGGGSVGSVGLGARGSSADQYPEEVSENATGESQRLSDSQVEQAITVLKDSAPLTDGTSAGSRTASNSATNEPAANHFLGKAPASPQSQSAQNVAKTTNNNGNGELDKTIQSYQEAYSNGARLAGNGELGAADAHAQASKNAALFQGRLESWSSHYSSAAEQAAYQETYNATFKAGKDKGDFTAVTDGARAAGSAADQIGLMNRVKTQIASTKDPNQQAQLKQAYKEMTDALISKDVYNDTSIKAALPPGVSRIESPQELGQLGLKRSDLQDTKSGLYSAVYRDSNTKPPTYIIANRGTSKMADVREDYYQSQGFAASAVQYQGAVSVARKVAEAKKAGSFSGSVEFTGHSLGGGLASAQTLATGFPATTFDAAGLSRQTIEDNRLDLGNEKNIVAISNGDILTQVQTHPRVASVAAGAINMGLHVKIVRQTPAPAAGVAKRLPAVSLPSRNADGSIELGRPLSTGSMIANTVALHGLDYNFGAIAYVAAHISTDKK